MRTLLLALSTASISLAVSIGCSGAHNNPGGHGHGGSSGAGGSSGGGSQGGDFNCDYKQAGYEFCYSYSGMSALQTTSEQQACSAYPGASTPSSCPSANQSGCCENVMHAG